MAIFFEIIPTSNQVNFTMPCVLLSLRFQGQIFQQDGKGGLIQLASDDIYHLCQQNSDLAFYDTKKCGSKFEAIAGHREITTWRSSCWT